MPFSGTVASSASGLLDAAVFRGVASALVGLHDLTALPWWSTILAATATAKLVTFPFLVVSQRSALRYALARPQLERLLADARSRFDEHAFRHRWSQKQKETAYRMHASRMLREIYAKNQFHPLRSLSLALAQFPIWLSLSLALRRLCILNSPYSGTQQYRDVGMTSEGCLWLHDLTAADPHLILPIALALVNFCIVELLFMPFRGSPPPSKMGKIIKYGSYAGCFVLPLVAVLTPSAVAFFWLVSSCGSLCSHLLVKQPTFKRRFAIPILPGDPQRPVRDLLIHMARLPRRLYNAAFAK